MIQSLHIENIAVVKSLDVELQPGMTVLSGETGAGKSMIIDSLNLLLGARADRDLIRTGESRAEISAVFTRLPSSACRTLQELGFDVQDGEVMLSRVITASGSSARLNGRPVALSVLREVSGTLFNIHGQHDNQQLLDPHRHMALLDAYADCEAEKEAYRAVYQQIVQLRTQIDSLRRDAQEQARLSEMLRYQIADIDAVKPKKGEEEALTEQAKRLRNTEQITKCCALAEKALQGGEKGKGAIYLIDRAASAMEAVADSLPDAETLARRLREVLYELEDVADAASDLSDVDAGDALAQLDRVEARLDALVKLQRKYGSTAEEILAFRADAARQLEWIEHAEDHMVDLTEELKQAEAQAATLAAALSERRRRAAKGLTASVTDTLGFLDMPKVRFEVGITPRKDFGADGRDEVEFLIATNPGEPLLPLVKIASGGELARIMLSLKNVLNQCDGVDTVIFDEIDTGISGKTSRKVGMKLKEIGCHAQVLCVTHSAQIASLAHHHLYISKNEIDGRAETALTELTAEGRVEEIARILGGIEVTEVQRSAAREMIAEGERFA